MSNVTYEFVSSFDCSPGMIVMQLSGDTWLWTPVCAMAVIKETWEDEGIEKVSIVPLVPNDDIGGLAPPDMYLSFGEVMDSAQLAVYSMLHWGEARHFLAQLRAKVDNETGLEEFLDTFYGSGEMAKAITRVANALQMLGFGNTSQPGAIEGHTMKMMDKYSELSSSLADGLDSIAIAIADRNTT